jgi:hypothetical protein
MTSGLISTFLETRHAAEVAFWAKQNMQNAQALNGLSRQMFDHLTADELAEMAMILPESSVRSAAA